MSVNTTPVTDQEVEIAMALSGPNRTAESLRRTVGQIKVVKDAALRVSSAKRNEMMRQANYIEEQANYLANLARKMREMAQHMAIE